MSWRHILLTRLEMTNFKRFYGHHVIDLCTQPDRGKTLVLIGGDNGRGKTSIHEAINYAFYEYDDLPGIHTRPNYIRAVSDRLNRRALDEGSSDFGVAVNLSTSGIGPESQIRIERWWEPINRSVQNIRLRIFENGRPIDYIDEETPAAYQDFLRKLLPPRIAPFFFFDGERIQEFADDEDHERRMVEAIEDILHISVYKDLRDDLRKYVIDHVEKNEIHSSADDDLYQLQRDRERIENELESKKDRIAEIARERDELYTQKSSIDREIRRIASPHATERDNLIAERSRLQHELEEAKKDLQSAFELLPILLASDLRNALRSALEAEQNGLMSAGRLEQLQAQLDQIKQRVFESPVPPQSHYLSLSDAQIVFYSQRFDDACREIFGFADIGLQSFIHDIGESTRRKILARLETASNAGTRLNDAIQCRERLYNELRGVETKLQSTSDDPHVEKLIKQSNEINRRIGELQEEERTIEGEIQRLQADLTARIRQIEDRQEKRKATDKARKKIKLAQKAQRVLDDFIKRLALEKLNDLQRYMDEMYERLKKPEDPVRAIEIDPQTWQVILKDEQGRQLEKRVFSAGMREMYALSLLWALAKSSGRELPIVIDTPVGRLDKTNRRALFEKYLPHAGHQVIVLSTDTEVDVEWARRLEPYVARQYRLDYDSKTDSTVIRPGYFF